MNKLVTELYDLCLKIDTYWINAIAISNETSSLEIKNKNYLNAELAINQANALIDKIFHEIENLENKSNLSENNENTIDLDKINQYIDILSLENINIGTLLTIICELYNSLNNMPQETIIIENMQNDLNFEKSKK